MSTDTKGHSSADRGRVVFRSSAEPSTRLFSPAVPLSIWLILPHEKRLQQTQRKTPAIGFLAGLQHNPVRGDTPRLEDVATRAAFRLRKTSLGGIIQLEAASSRRAER